MKNKKLELIGTLNVIGEDSFTTITSDGFKGKFITSNKDGIKNGFISEINLKDGNIVITIE